MVACSVFIRDTQKYSSRVSHRSSSQPPLKRPAIGEDVPHLGTMFRRAELWSANCPEIAARARQRRDCAGTA